MALAESGASAGPPRRPAFSARDGASRAQKLWLAGLLLFIAITLVFASEPGLWLAMAVSPLFLGIIIVQLGATLEPQASAGPRGTAPGRSIIWPTYSVLIPLYREAAIVQQLIWAIERIDYPSDRLEVMLLLEADDEETRRAVQNTPCPSFVHPVIVPDGFPRTKPRALNVGLALAAGELLCVFDAEDVPEPDQLKLAAMMFAEAEPDVLCLQARLAIDNGPDGWLARMLAIEYAALYDVIKSGLAGAGLPVPLGGTSNHFRRSSLIRLGGWDAWNVTEDADLGLRIARARGRVVELPSTTFEEAPICLGGWLQQRRRWLKGWMQTCLTHTRRPLHLVRDLGAARGMHALALLAANTFGPAVGLWITFYVLHDSIVGELLNVESAGWRQMVWIWVALAGFGVISLILPILVAIVRANLWSSAPWLLLRPLHWLCVSCAAFHALHELRVRPHHWSKTRHGLAHAQKDHSALVIEVASIPKSSSCAS